MRFVIVAAAVLLVAGCSDTEDKVRSEQVNQSHASSTCGLPDRGNVIVRETIPGRPVDAVEIAGTDPEHCVWTIDAMKTSVPTGPGFCFEMAWASDNIDYSISSVPAPPLKNVQAAIGHCG